MKCTSDAKGADTRTVTESKGGRSTDVIRAELAAANREYARISDAWVDADDPLSIPSSDEAEKFFRQLDALLKPHRDKRLRLLDELRAAELTEFAALKMQQFRSLHASNAARASHAKHRDNKQAARDWYTAHKPMTKDDAAQRMHDDRIIAASFRTIRGYLTGQ